MKKMIYLCGNDGTDARVVKELRSYSKKYSVFFIGVKGPEPFIHDRIQHKLFPGSHKNIFTILKMNLLLLSFFLKRCKYERVHIVDEQFYFFFIPVLFLTQINKTLDIFDSIFLKKDFAFNKAYLLKKYIYGSVDKIIVTDENRLEMLPDFAKKKAIIIPNVPFRNAQFDKEKPYRKGALTIAYFGTLLRNRGSEFMEEIIRADKKIKFLLAGWVGDNYTKELISKHVGSIEYFGTISQDQANDLLFNRSDYILCIYPFNNLNNINASPNKIYDSILTKTPVIMNSEIKVSNLVRKLNIGYLFSFSNFEIMKLIGDLNNNKNNYRISNSLSRNYEWENYEEILIS
ncbi:hypothetical protein OAE81_00355 [bacterium]|nr:hypothetical protein [bacterium]